MSLILGIDPGSKYTGFAIIKKSDQVVKYVQSGVIKIPGSLSFQFKLLFLSQELEQIFNDNKISEVSLEKIFFGKNADSAFKLGHIRGACMVSAARHNIEVFEYAAKYVKKVVTGSGSSSKESVQTFVNQYLQIKVNQLDESDALALALCHTTQIQVEDNLNQNFRI